MNKLSVLITTSGIGERLKNYTKYTNKSLIKIGDKFAICYIIEKYDINTEFIITLGYYGNYVRDFLLLSYPTRKFIFVEIDNYDRTGSSLGYSLLKCRDYIHTPFIFHCCDTIILDDITTTEQNTLFVYKLEQTLENSNKYSTINVKYADAAVASINRKGYRDFDYVYIGLAYIYDYSLFFELLEQEYKKNPSNSSLSDIDVYISMFSQNIEFYYKVINEWYDTGNIENYLNVNRKFPRKYKVLDKDNESICFIDGGVIKFINNVEINKQRIIRGNILYPYSPKIISYRDNFMMMEKIEGIVLSQYKNASFIYDLLQWSKKYLWVNPQKNIEYKINCRNFYINKTLKRIENIINEKEYNYVNGLFIPPVNVLIDIIDKSKVLETDTFYNFHGDFILENIICTGSTNYVDKYKLLDWRNEFDIGQIDVGDIYYDLSKMRHNIFLNHDSILDELYSIEIINNEVLMDIKSSFVLIDQLGEYEKFIIENKMDIKKIEILTALIWLNMSSLYSGKLREFLFYFGKYNLYLSSLYLIDLECRA